MTTFITLKLTHLAVENVHMQCTFNITVIVMVFINALQTLLSLFSSFCYCSRQTARHQALLCFGEMCCIPYNIKNKICIYLHFVAYNTCKYIYIHSICTIHIVRIISSVISVEIIRFRVFSLGLSFKRWREEK